MRSLALILLLTLSAPAMAAEPQARNAPVPALPKHLKAVGA